jgi:hypothetical protein
MGSKLEYDFAMRRLIPASVAAFALSFLFCVCLAEAQVRGVPTSVTSTGFGGHFGQAPGIAPSVTSLGPLGYSGQKPFNCCFSNQFPNHSNAPLFLHRHRRAPLFPLGGDVYAVPYPVYVVDPAADDSAEENDYPSGPTIFDRRASGQSSAAAEAAYSEHRRAEPAIDPTSESEPAIVATADAAAVPDQPRTVLVFKNGHQLEVQNYAIVGSMLYDLTPGHRAKIALADLDLTATAKQNDDRGIDFQLPADRETN